MYLNLKILFRALYLAFFRQRFHLRRWAIVILFTGLFFFFWCSVAVARLLDHIFFPRFRRQPLREPIFIVAPPRSGTTFLQNLMALDEERFTHLRLYQTIFPAVVFLRSIDALAWLDRRAGGLLGRLVRWSEKLFFRGWQDIHPMSFNRPEEDEAFFVYTLVADSIFLLFPYPRELWGAAFADDLPPKTRRRLMRFYVSCLRRHLHATGPGKTLLVKNTPLCGRLTSLLEAIPDARVISIIRHPDASVPSHVSPFWRTWSVHSPEIAKDSEESRVYAEVAVEWFRRIFGNRERFDRRRHLLLRYDELIADPVRTVEAIYRHFDLPLGDGFRKRLAVAAEKARRYRSNHAYSLEEFGLSPAWIRERLGGLIDSYALESEPAALAPPHGRPAVAAAAGKQSTAVGGLT